MGCHAYHGSKRAKSERLPLPINFGRGLLTRQQAYKLPFAIMSDHKEGRLPQPRKHVAGDDEDSATAAAPRPAPKSTFRKIKSNIYVSVPAPRVSAPFRRHWKCSPPSTCFHTCRADWSKSKHYVRSCAGLRVLMQHAPADLQGNGEVPRCSCKPGAFGTAGCQDGCLNRLMYIYLPILTCAVRCVYCTLSTRA